MSTSAPHYPTTAELAAFRALYAYPLAPPAPGAWDAEIRNGIGYRDTPGRWPATRWNDARKHAAARREATALRSRAYARADAYEPWDGRDQQAFAPTR